MEQLLAKVSFDSAKGDHLIFTGNMVSDSVKSVPVIELARKHYASCVRGANEDRVLLVRRQMSTSNLVPLAGPTESAMGGDGWDHMDQESFSQGDYKDRALATELGNDHADWLDSCPVILRVGQIKGMGEVVVVHSGLVPGVELASQDPSSVMGMRTIDLKTHVPSASEEGMPWFKVSLIFSTPVILLVLYAVSLGATYHKSHLCLLGDLTSCSALQQISVYPSVDPQKVICRHFPPRVSDYYGPLRKRVGQFSQYQQIYQRPRHWVPLRRQALCYGHQRWWQARDREGRLQSFHIKTT